MKNHSRNLHAPLCGIFCPNSVVVARYDASSEQNLPQIVTHILQKAFFKHALVQRKLRKNSGSLKKFQDDQSFLKYLRYCTCLIALGSVI